MAKAKKAKTTRKAVAVTTGKSKRNVRPSDVIGIISQADFLTLVRQVRTRQGAIDEARGDMGGLISQAVEKKRLDKVAFAIFRRLNRLEDKRLATTLTHLEHYVEVGGLNERATAQAELIEREELKTNKGKGKKAKPEQMDLSEREDIQPAPPVDSPLPGEIGPMLPH